MSDRTSLVGGRIEVDLSPAEALRAAGIRKAVRIGISRASSPVKASVVSHAEAVRRYGFLAKSIRIKLRLYSADRWVSVIGPSMKFAKNKGKYTRGKRKGEPRVNKPWKYARLVEGGTKRSRARPWLKPAYAETAGAFIARAGAEIGREVEAELQRHRAKRGSKT